MARTDDDNWDLASSVGATATFVASGRAMATKDPRGLINDPFAEPLVRAVGLDFFTKMMDGELDISTVEDASARKQAMIDGMAVRTKYYDDYFVAATNGGVRQAVILASGLDAQGLPSAVARRDGGLRARSTAGDRFQDKHFGRDRRRTARHSAHHSHRSAPRLAGGAQGRRPGPVGADRVVGRGPADLPAARTPRIGCSTTSPR